MSSLEKQQAGDTYWRSLGELNDSPRFRAFLEAEFPEELDPGGMSRRRWLQLMGASIALAGVAGCRWPRKEILPLVVRPQGRVPGEAEYYATAMDLCGTTLGLLVTSRDGRPVKIEGNPGHPASQGGTHAFAQASILELYDPDRSRGLKQYAGSDGTSKEWAEFQAFAEKHFAGLRAAKGKGLAILAEASSSPTRAALQARFAKSLPEARWYEYEPINDDNVREGSTLAFGAPHRTHYRPESADVIVCVDCDLLSGHPNSVQYARGFAAGRDPKRGPEGGRMNRLYAIESRYTLTGAAADHRLPMRSREIAAWLSGLEEAIRRQLAGEKAGEQTPFLAAIVQDLTGSKGRSLVAVGASQPSEVHAAAHRINQSLGNAGKTVVYYADANPERPGHMAAMRSLVADMNAGNVKMIVVLGGNPVYNAPADVKFSEAYAKVAERVHLSPYSDETSRESTWHIPKAHFLESWDDARASDGTYSIVQPLISPLWGGKTSSEMIAVILGEQSTDGQSLVRRTFGELFGQQDFEANWKKAVHDGLVAGSEGKPAAPAIQAAKSAPGKAAETQAKEGELEIVFCADDSVFDGRFANNGWLQEAPRPISHITWDNAAVMHPATARRLKIDADTFVRVQYSGQSLELPVYLLPGHAKDSVTISLGYGRKAAGNVGGDSAQKIDSVGANAYTLRTSSSPFFGSGLEVSPTGKAYTLATTEEHHAIDNLSEEARKERGSELLRESTLKEYEAHPEFAKHAVHHPPLESLWNEWSYEGHRWGMTVDLNKCIGCNACVVACQAENNVPVVGRQLVLKGREMHWIRIDRYFRGDSEAESPPISHQVVTCQQCENAPCEQVCPVAATVHSHEGLNDMVYNRCIGTRYCANNCPYKVRRFNYFYFHWDLEKPENEVKKMVYNPEVTIRSRGVMEKCTYCVQRVQAAKIVSKNERRPIADGEVMAACQQSCPSRAIVFGDLNNRESQVARAQDDHRSYAMLAELNIKPRTSYLARVRNPHPSLDKAEHEHPNATT